MTLLGNAIFVNLDFRTGAVGARAIRMVRAPAVAPGSAPPKHPTVNARLGLSGALAQVAILVPLAILMVAMSARAPRMVTPPHAQSKIVRLTPLETHDALAQVALIAQTAILMVAMSARASLMVTLPHALSKIVRLTNWKNLDVID